MSNNDYMYTKPIEVRGGIRAGSKRGAFGSSWWAKRWLQALEEFQIGNRLSRGRSYARRGQVISIDVRPGGVTAKVQGSRKRPYDVSIDVRTLTPPDWERIQAAMVVQPIIAASLLSGRDAGQHRGHLQVRRPVHVPRPEGRPGDGLLVSRLVQPVQARRRRVPAAGRGV